MTEAMHFRFGLLIGT